MVFSLLQFCCHVPWCSFRFVSCVGGSLSFLFLWVCSESRRGSDEGRWKMSDLLEKMMFDLGFEGDVFSKSPPIRR